MSDTVQIVLIIAVAFTAVVALAAWASTYESHGDDDE